MTRSPATDRGFLKFAAVPAPVARPRGPGRRRGSQRLESGRELYTRLRSPAPVQEPAEPPGTDGAPFEHRLTSILDVARLHRTAVALDDLTELLPESAPRDSEGLSRWLADHPQVGEVIGPLAGRPGALPAPTLLDERRARGVAYRQAAERLVGETLRPVGPLVRCVGLTGSAAYLEPEEGDDLDLLVVTRSGALWVFLSYTYLALHLRRRGAMAPGVDPCLNFVMDDVEAGVEFGRPRGFLFAREALTTRPLDGEEYLRGLVSANPWLGEEVPRLYSRWTSGGAKADPRPRPAPRAIQALNLALFLPMSAYLQLVGLVRNHRARRRGDPDPGFRTITRLRRLCFQSDRFVRLHRVYEGAPSAHAPPSEVPG